jgi:hypothetical protein
MSSQAEDRRAWWPHPLSLDESLSVPWPAPPSGGGLIPDPTLEAEFNAARTRYWTATGEIVPLLVRMALDNVSEVLPGAQTIEVEGGFTEDWMRTLRIQRVLGESDTVLYDVEFGHADRRVEDVINEVNSVYLDFLLDLTGDAYMGRATIEAEPS